MTIDYKNNIEAEIEQLIKFYKPHYKPHKELQDKRNVYKGIVIGLQLLKQRLDNLEDTQ